MSEEETQPTAPLRLHAIVRGLVQGVNFRAYAVREAVQANLTGWIRNLRDGSVETVAEGPRANLDDFLAFLKVGSPSAQVTHVDVTWEDATGEFSEFRIRHF